MIFEFLGSLLQLFAKYWYSFEVRIYFFYRRGGRKATTSQLFSTHACNFISPLTRRFAHLVDSILTTLSFVDRKPVVDAFDTRHGWALYKMLTKFPCYFYLSFRVESAHQLLYLLSANVFQVLYVRL